MLIHSRQFLEPIDLSLEDQGRIFDQNFYTSIEIANSEVRGFLQSLAFPEMNYWPKVADKAHPGTCGWILNHTCYQKWINSRHGLLWINGKPGSGKSTLMAYLSKVTQGILASDQVLSLNFFFHRHGAELQKNVEGMLLSLLSQVYMNISATRNTVSHAFRDKQIFGEVGKARDWQIKKLKDLLSDTILHVVRKIIIFVDALDEAGEQGAREVAEFFYQLNEQLSHLSQPIKICISCRYYPIVATVPNLEICVEKHNDKDISTYVRDKLSSNIQDGKNLRNLEKFITDKALGVFQWACLVTPTVIKLYNGEESLEDIYAMLAKIPSELKEVYQHIIENVVNHRHRSKTLHLMQWICLAERPLSLTELRFALAAEMCDSSSQLRCEDVNGFVESDNRMEKQVTSLSGGLAEVRHQESGATVQFVHQSVNDYLLSGGLTFLISSTKDISTQGSAQSDSSSTDSTIGKSQHRLTKACINYLKLEEVVKNQNVAATNLLQQQLPLISYATEFWFVHAKKAENHGVLQAYIAQEFSSSKQAFKKWLAVYCNIRQTSCLYHPAHNFQKDSTMLHIASHSNLRSVVEALLQNNVFVDEEDAAGNRSLHFVAREGFDKLLNLLLEAGADKEAKNKKENTPLELAAANGHETIVARLLQRGANINERTGWSGNALQGAVSKGSKRLVHMLLNNGAEVNVQGGQYGNALQVASYRGNEAIVRLLLDKGAEVNAQGGQYGNALQAASSEGHKTIVRLLLDKGADVNAQGGQYVNTLQAASSEGREAIVQLLLDKGAETKAQGGLYSNALKAASSGGHEAIVRKSEKRLKRQLTLTDLLAEKNVLKRQKVIHVPRVCTKS